MVDQSALRRHAEAVARARLRAEGLDHGLSLEEAEGYADAALPTVYGRSIVMGYLVDNLRAEVGDSFLGRRLVSFVAWYAKRVRRG